MFRAWFEKKLVSIVICNKNSLQILKATIESLKNQTYKNFEVIIIDGKSTDGSVEFLESQRKFLNLKIISEIDSGISEAYSKGLAHVSGEIVGILAADERYYPNTIKTVVKLFKKYPNHIVCGGSCKFLNEDEKEVDKYLDDYLELERHLSCEHVCAILPSFFNKKLLGKDLFYKTSQKTCPDYDLWARLALKYSKEKFSWFDLSLVKALRTASSMSFRPNDFNRMVDDKIAYLKEFMAENSHNERLKFVSIKRCMAGIHMWAAEQIMSIDFNNINTIFHCNKAYELDPSYERINQFVQKYDLEICDENAANEKIVNHTQPNQIAETISNVFTFLLLPKTGGKIICEKPLKIKTSNLAWGYVAEIKFDEKILENLVKSSKDRYWIKISIKTQKGAVGVGKKYNNQIVAEKIIKNGEEKDLFFKIKNSDLKDLTLLIRSAGEADSIANIAYVGIEKEHK